MVKRGIAYHHAGLVVSDRHYIEELFRSGYLPVLVSTSTLGSYYLLVMFLLMN